MGMGRMGAQLGRMGGLGGGRLTSPKQIANLVQWLDAADTSSFTISTGVSQWNDKSGVGVNVAQATGAKQPTSGRSTLNGRNVISFDGVDDEMSASWTRQLSGGCTVFAVASARQTEPVTKYHALLRFSSAFLGIQFEGSGDATSPRKFEAFTQNGASTLFRATPSKSMVLGPRVVSSIIDASGATITLWKNGVVDGGPTAITGSLKSTAADTFRVGWDGSLNDQGAYDIAEVLVYNRVLSATERQRVEAYLGNKWGIALPGTVPSPALLYGFNNLVFSDDFDSLSTIDVNASGVAGFKWYPQNFFGSVNTPAADISVSNSILTLNGSINNGTDRCRLQTRGYLGAGATVGQSLFSAGGYFEASMAFDIANSTGSNNGWPSFWAQDQALLIGQTTGVSTSGGEIDFWEAVPLAAGTITPTMNAHDWRNSTGPGSGTNYAQSNYVVNLGSPDYTQFHKYGCLWVPKARNDAPVGTGVLHRFFDDQYVSTSQLTYSAGAVPTPNGGGAPAGAFSVLDSGSYVVLLDGSYHWPTQFDYVKIWQ